MVENPGFLADKVLGNNFASMPGIKPRQALPLKTFFSASNEILAAAFLLHDSSIRLPGRQPQDHLVSATRLKLAPHERRELKKMAAAAPSSSRQTIMK